MHNIQTDTVLYSVGFILLLHIFNSKILNFRDWTVIYLNSFIDNLSLTVCTIIVNSHIVCSIIFIYLFIKEI